MMNSINLFLVKLMNAMTREEGQTMAEYGVLLAVIALVVVTVAITLGSSIESIFTKIANGL